LNFFIYVIDNTAPPYNIKLHITNEQPYELTDSEIRASMHAYVQAKARHYYDPNQLGIDVKQYPSKNQTKIFLRFY
jgi:hypothetical protein